VRVLLLCCYCTVYFYDFLLRRAFIRNSFASFARRPFCVRAAAPRSTDRSLLACLLAFRAAGAIAAPTRNASLTNRFLSLDSTPFRPVCSVCLSLSRTAVWRYCQTRRRTKAPEAQPEAVQAVTIPIPSSNWPATPLRTTKPRSRGRLRWYVTTKK